MSDEEKKFKDKVDQIDDKENDYFDVRKQDNKNVSKKVKFTYSKHSFNRENPY